MSDCSSITDATDFQLRIRTSGSVHAAVRKVAKDVLDELRERGRVADERPILIIQ